MSVLEHLASIQSLSLFFLPDFLDLFFRLPVSFNKAVPHLDQRFEYPVLIVSRGFLRDQVFNLPNLVFRMLWLNLGQIGRQFEAVLLSQLGKAFVSEPGFLRRPGDSLEGLNTSG